MPFTVESGHADGEYRHWTFRCVTCAAEESSRHADKWVAYQVIQHRGWRRFSNQWFCPAHAERATTAANSTQEG